MIGQPRIGLKSLAATCRRLAISLGAGVDVRTVFNREANAARGPGGRSFSEISAAVADGGSICDGFKDHGSYFPEFFRQMVHVGETTGHLPEVFRQLADHYEHQLKLRRSLVSSITWPLIELGLALSVIGLLIWLMGMIPQLKGADMLGLGLQGTSGLLKYLGFLAIVAAIGLFFYRATVRGVLWVAPLQRAVMRVPQLGHAIETLAIARLAWAMHVTMNSGMEVREALKLSLRSTQNVVYTQHIDTVIRKITAGQEIYEALRETGAFPLDFLDAVQVGEDSGQLVESMGRLADQYQDQAKLAMNTMTILLGVAISGLIAGIIIYFIYQIFSRAYMAPLNDALKMKH
jgi:type IV pilus assembly protein PilC